MNASVITDDVVSTLGRRFGKARPIGQGRVLTFGTSFACSINYSKLLGGHKFFFAVPNGILQPREKFPATKHGEFVLLICGSARNVLVLPRALVLDMLRGVPTRRVDVFLEGDSYILQTTKHPKLVVSEYLNRWPVASPASEESEPEADETSRPCRAHVRVQWGLISLGRAEGCSVWVPIADRNLSYRGSPFAERTLARLPNLGLDENARRIVQNIDVLWLTRNVIRKAFEVEATTSVYSGLLRLNDLALSQPNTKVDLYLVAERARREKVYRQLLRPSFQQLLPRCRFLSFQSVEDNLAAVERMPVDQGARVSGLIQGESFELPEHSVYPELD